MLNNMMIIDRVKMTFLKMDIYMFDYVIVRESNDTYTFLKNRHNDIKYEGLTEYQLHEKLNDIAIGIIPEKVD